ncbi:regulation of nuclear pre-mRNA domain-containing protein 1A-like [Spea bombifrons]|uniref:regulation of nuclear pre-mRNA domain-containing protein 1A-like n=1 Tax=Spea bombifrons TaxID=233779 RepID=UPI00234AB7F2|nr:regulation of nuclear pre-mRNA domain-containing protein 1A-like [Spea bombifrons]
MATFSTESFEKKLSELTYNRTSVHTLSYWLIHYRKHSQVIVSVWHRELRKAEASRKLIFLYLAHEVIQSSTRKGPEYTEEFARVIVDAFKHAVPELDGTGKKHLGKFLSVWEDKAVYNRVILEQLKIILYGEKKPKKRLYSEVKGGGDDDAIPAKYKPAKAPSTANNLLRVIQEVESAASRDAAVHQEISFIPREVQDLSYLGKPGDLEYCRKHSTLVRDASKLLAEGYGRLAAEVDDRKQLIGMLSNFLQHQKVVNDEKEHQLEMYKNMLERAKKIQEQLRTRLEDKPDLTHLSSGSQNEEY